MVCITSRRGPQGLVTGWFPLILRRRQRVVLAQTMIVTWPYAYGRAPNLPSKKKFVAIPVKDALSGFCRGLEALRLCAD